ncbi:thioredoxin family protein [Methanohalophilus sp.]
MIAGNRIMHGFVLIVMLLAFVAAGCTTPEVNQQPQNSVQESNIKDIEQLNTLLEEEPVLIKFGSPTCPPCQDQDVILDSIADDYEGEASVIMVNINEERDAASFFRVSSIPDMSVIAGIKDDRYLFMGPDGNVSFERGSTRYVGLKDANTLRQALDNATAYRQNNTL